MGFTCYCIYLRIVASLRSSQEVLWILFIQRKYRLLPKVVECSNFIIWEGIPLVDTHIHKHIHTHHAYREREREREREKDREREREREIHTRFVERPRENDSAQVKMIFSSHGIAIIFGSRCQYAWYERQLINFKVGCMETELPSEK